MLKEQAIRDISGQILLKRNLIDSLRAASITTAPITTAPITTAPITTAPITTAPITTAPITTAPITTAPITTAPITTAPITTAPITTAPITTAPSPSPSTITTMPSTIASSLQSTVYDSINSIKNTMFTSNALKQFISDYKTHLPNSTNEDRYLYQHYGLAQKGIVGIEIGRFPSDKLNTIGTGWIKQPGFNSPNGWKMRFAEKYAELKKAEYNNVMSGAITKNPGLSFTMREWKYTETIDQNNKIQIMSTGIDSLTAEPMTAILGRGNCIKMDTFQNATANKSFMTTGTPPAKLNAMNGVIVEWYGYFIPEDLGEYKFQITGASSNCLLWIGENAVNEYLITTQFTDSSLKVNEIKIYPIRIHYFINKDDSPSFKLEITDPKTNIVSNGEKYLYGLTKNGTPYFPRYIYYAFVSDKLENFKEGRFECYAINTSDTTDQTTFYNLIQKNKQDVMTTRKYDKDTSANILEFGTLTDGIYTQYSDWASPSANEQIPKVFAVYRINTDPRINKTFQIDKNSISPYSMKEVDKSLVLNGDSYNDYAELYPDESSNTNQEDSKKTCEQKCTDNPRCNFYYSFSNSDNTKTYCKMDTEKSNPTYSTVKLPNTSNSTLYLRNKKIMNNVCKFGSPVSYIENTTTYDATDPYANYKILPDNISDLGNLGNCGDPSNVEFETRARDLLFKNMDYVYEPMTTVNTNAISDTKTYIGKDLTLENGYENKNKKINANFKQMRDSLVPKYDHDRAELNGNVNYDYNGQVLLNFRQKLVPNVKQQALMDANEKNLSQYSLYVLGTITSASLLVMALVIGKE